MRADTITALPAPSRPTASAPRGGRALRIVLPAAAAGATGLLVGVAAALGTSADQASWVVGRAAGVTCYLLLVALVGLGLLLAHPGLRGRGGPSRATRLRAHVALAGATLAAFVLHVVVLATDAYAGVGWAGALLPLGSGYRPIPVTLGLLGAWIGLLAGLTAALAGRGTGRAWLPLHRIAVVSLVLVWAHAVLAGSDLGALRWVYLLTGVALVGLAASRVLTPDPQRRPGPVAEGRRS